jgi:hypothetical protein
MARLKSIEDALYRELDKWIDENEDEFIPDVPLDKFSFDLAVPTLMEFPSTERNFDAIDSKFGGNTVAGLISNVLHEVSEISYQISRLVTKN